MRGSLLVVLTAVSAVAAFPSYDDGQIVFGISKGEPIAVPPKFDRIEDNAKQWVQNGRDFIHRDGITCESVHPLA